MKQGHTEAACGNGVDNWSVVAAPWLQSTAAAAAKSLQSCPTLCNPIDGSLPGSSVHAILQARILEWVAISCSTKHLHLSN